MTEAERRLLRAFLTWCDTQGDLVFLGQDEANKYVELGESDYEGLVDDYGHHLAKALHAALVTKPVTS